MHAQDEPALLLGDSHPMQSVREDIRAAARSDAKVLITGDTGVGKDVVARLIHRESVRAAAPFVAINCAGVPETLLESELFGHARGSFTGAVRDKLGLLESATGGSIFFDEIGEMSLRMQAVLLRFLETGEIQRVGAERAPRRANVRCIAATNRDLGPAIAGGMFRQDLYYRINVVRISVPALRDRGDDILLLLEHFVRHYSEKHRVPVSRLAADAERVLCSYSWPGNVRQLKNLAERLVLLGRGRLVEAEDLPGEILDVPQVRPDRQHSTGSRAVEVELLERMLRDGESFWSVVHAPFMHHDLSRAHLQAVVASGLEKTGGNYRRVARLFNMDPGDYKRFLSFLRQHDCKLPYQPYRAAGVRATDRPRTIDADWFSPVSLAGAG